MSRYAAMCSFLYAQPFLLLAYLGLLPIKTALLTIIIMFSIYYFFFNTIHLSVLQCEAYSFNRIGRCPQELYVYVMIYQCWIVGIQNVSASFCGLAVLSHVEQLVDGC